MGRQFMHPIEGYICNWYRSLISVDQFINEGGASEK